MSEVFIAMDGDVLLSADEMKRIAEDPSLCPFERVSAVNVYSYCEYPSRWQPAFCRHPSCATPCPLGRSAIAGWYNRWFQRLYGCCQKNLFEFGLEVAHG